MLKEKRTRAVNFACITCNLIYLVSVLAVWLKATGAIGTVDIGLNMLCRRPLAGWVAHAGCVAVQQPWTSVHDNMYKCNDVVFLSSSSTAK